MKHLLWILFFIALAVLSIIKDWGKLSDIILSLTPIIGGLYLYIKENSLWFGKFFFKIKQLIFPSDFNAEIKVKIFNIINIEYSYEEFCKSLRSYNEINFPISGNTFSYRGQQIRLSETSGSILISYEPRKFNLKQITNEIKDLESILKSIKYNLTLDDVSIQIKLQTIDGVFLGKNLFFLLGGDKKLSFDIREVDTKNNENNRINFSKESDQEEIIISNRSFKKVEDSLESINTFNFNYGK